MSLVRFVWAWGPSTGPTACALVSCPCALWGWRKGVPGGGAFRRCEGRLSSGAPPPPAARPPGGLSGSAAHVLWVRVCGCGGPALAPWFAYPVGGCVPRGWWGAVPGGGVAFHRCEGHLVSGAVPPPAARPLGRVAGFPRPVYPGCGWCGRGDPAPAPQRALLRAVFALCGGGGRALPGGVPSAVVRGVGVQALLPPRLPALWAGCRVLLPTCCGRGCVGVWARHCPLGLHALWGAGCCGGDGGPSPGGWAFHHCEGRLDSGAPPPPAARPLGGLPRSAVYVLWARMWVCVVCVVPVWCLCAGGCVVVRLPLWYPPLGCCVVVLCPSCACRAPFSSRVPCSAAGYAPFSFVVVALFTLSSTLCWPALLPGVHFSPAFALVFVWVFLLAYFLGPASRVLFFLSCWVL